MGVQQNKHTEHYHLASCLGIQKKSIPLLLLDKLDKQTKESA